MYLQWESSKREFSLFVVSSNGQKMEFGTVQKAGTESSAIAKERDNLERRCMTEMGRLVDQLSIRQPGEVDVVDPIPQKTYEKDENENPFSQCSEAGAAEPLLSMYVKLEEGSGHFKWSIQDFRQLCNLVELIPGVYDTYDVHNPDWTFRIVYYSSMIDDKSIMQQIHTLSRIVLTCEVKME